MQNYKDAYASVTGLCTTEICHIFGGYCSFVEYMGIILLLALGGGYCEVCHFSYPHNAVSFC